MPRQGIGAVLLAAALASCATPSSDEERALDATPTALSVEPTRAAMPSPADDPDPSQPCAIAAAEPFRGRAPDADTLAALQRATGALMVRLAPSPGTPMLAEGEPGRLTVTLDDAGRMALFACE